MTIPELTPPRPNRTETVQFGSFRFDHAERVLTRDGEEVRLPPRVLGVLQLLLEREGKVVSKHELIEKVWGGAFVTDTSLTEAISVLRQALGDEAQDPNYLQTVHRRGYRFIAPVQPAIGAAKPIVAFGPAAIDAAEAAAPSRQAPWLVGVSAVILIAIAIAIAVALRSPATGEATYVTVTSLDGSKLHPWASLAISPDARHVVYSADHEGTPTLFHRSLDRFDVAPIAGTDRGIYPFFSPDGEWVAFFSGGKLSKVKLSGGAPIALCRINGAGQGTWTEDGWIIFSVNTSGLRRVSDRGGDAEVITTPDAAAGEVEHTAPQILPDGDTVLFTAFANTVHSAKVATVSLRSRERRVVLEHAAGARYVAPGYLVYATSDGIRVSRFDARRGRVMGEPFAAIPDMLSNPFSGAMYFDVAANGTAVFFSGTVETPVRELATRDAAGTVTPLPTPRRYYRNLEIAPDGRRAAVTILENDRSDVWVADLGNGTLSRLTFDGFNIEPVWSPDGEWVYYASNRTGPYNIWRRRADGQSAPERMRESSGHEYPMYWAPDGNALVISEADPSTAFDLAVLERSGGGWKHRPLVHTPGIDMIAQLSPDGRWLAYMAHQGAEWNIFIQDFPAGQGKWQISTGSGWDPFWSADGSTLHYLDAGNIVSVPLTFVDGGIRRGPEATFEHPGIYFAQRGAAPGELTLIRESNAPKEQQRELRMVIGWAKSLGEK